MSSDNNRTAQQSLRSLQQIVAYDRETVPSLLEVVNNAVLLVDADLHLTAQNEIAAEMMGWISAEVIGRTIYDLLPSNTGAFHELCLSIAQAVEKRQSVSFEQGVTLIGKNERPILIGGRAAPVFREGQPVGAICAFWKILPEKDDAYLRFEFANMASHLMRTPLSFIQASIDFLINSELDSSQQQLMLRKMRDQSQRLIRFTNELLKVLRSETEATHSFAEAVPLLPLIERILQPIKDENPRHVIIVLETDEFPMVFADSTKIELILLNLLLNAVRRSPADGQITIELKIDLPEAIISISDNGLPVPTKLLERIFWQFYPVDDGSDKMPSTYHLGLYNTKRLVELQNGRIWVTSHPDQGARFNFSLPIWENTK